MWAPLLILPGQSVSPGTVSGKVRVWSLLVHGLPKCALSPELNPWFNRSISGAQHCCWAANLTVALTEGAEGQVAVTLQHMAWQSFSGRSSKHSGSYRSMTVAGERGSSAVVLSLSESFGTWIWTQRMLTRELKDFQIYQIARSCQVGLRTFLCKWDRDDSWDLSLAGKCNLNICLKKHWLKYYVCKALPCSRIQGCAKRLTAQRVISRAG